MHAVVLRGERRIAENLVRVFVQKRSLRQAFFDPLVADDVSVMGDGEEDFLGQAADALLDFAGDQMRRAVVDLTRETRGKAPAEQFHLRLRSNRKRRVVEGGDGRAAVNGYLLLSRE